MDKLLRHFSDQKWWDLSSLLLVSLRKLLTSHNQFYLALCNKSVLKLESFLQHQFKNPWIKLYKALIIILHQILSLDLTLWIQNLRTKDLSRLMSYRSQYIISVLLLQKFVSECLYTKVHTKNFYSSFHKLMSITKCVLLPKYNENQA